MGETDEQLVDVAFALRDLDPDSVPVNFLIPFEGTPLGGQWNLTPQRCLRILAMVRFVCPDAEVRLAGGREVHLRSLQPLALHIVNSIFLGDYLTSEGQSGHRDLEMIADAGFTVEGADERTLPAPPAGPGARPPPRPRHDLARQRLTRWTSRTWSARPRCTGRRPRSSSAQVSTHLASLSPARALYLRCWFRDSVATIHDCAVTDTPPWCSGCHGFSLRL